MNIGNLCLNRTISALLGALGGVGAVALATTLGPVDLAAQSGLPTRLVRSSDLIHLGSFAVPATGDLAYASGVITFNPAANSLFVVGHEQRQDVGEITIPKPGGVATLRQALRDALEGRIGQVKAGDSNGYRIGGMTVVGSTLVLSAYAYYDANHGAVASHFTRSTNLSASGTLRGPFRVGDLPVGLMAGYFAPIPAEWQGALGGDLLNGQCCIPIISRSSYGPSVSAVRAQDLLTSDRPSSTTLVAYPDAHQTLGTFSSTYGQDGSLYNGSSSARGVAFPAGTASVLFFGRTGTGEFCYGTGPECGDPDNMYQGNHAYPYVSNVWAYDAHDLAAVRRGERDPWEVKPYATWRIPNVGTNVRGAAIDPSTGRIYVSELIGDTLRIHIFAVSGSTGSGQDSTPPTVTLTSPASGSQLTGVVTLSASASDNAGVASVWFTIDGQTIKGEDTSPPYQIAWDSRAASSGSHTIQAVARDASGNARASAGVSVTVVGGGASSCTSIRPGSDWNCYNGNWLPPGMPIPGQSVAAPAQPEPLLPALGSVVRSLLPCLSIRPGADWNCYDGNWLPPGMPIPNGGASTQQTPTTVQPAAPSSSGECTSVRPGILWTCRNGNWLPPGYPDR